MGGHSVVLEVDTPEDILARHYANGRVGGLVVPGNPPGAVGEVCTLTLHIHRPAREFRLQGQLAWARYRSRAGLDACFGVDFADVEMFRRILAFARNEITPEAMRVEPRLPVQLQARLYHRGQVRREHLADLSLGGAFVRTTAPLDPGEDCDLELRGEPLVGLTLKARVAWNRFTGEHPGMGLAFLELPPAKRSRLLVALGKLQAAAGR